MAKCNCSGQTCGCRLRAGEGISITGSGNPRDEFVISAETPGGGGGGAGSWFPGDLKDTVRTGPAPAGWLDCDGRTVSRSAYADLFAAIGTRWGQGDGFSTFNLPDFGGRSRLGVGAGYALGASGGAATTTLNVANMPAHTHTIGNHSHRFQHTHSMAHGHGNTSDVSNFHQHQVSIKFSTNDNTATVSGSGGARRVTDVGSGSGDATVVSSSSGGHVHGIPNFDGRTDGPTPENTDAAGAQTTSSAGQGASFTNLPPYRVVRVLIHT